ncbi:[protein-PII] uridylyltransferase [Lacipirellula sp.]|uniref:[protein-PII] uridylyltransferase n=1 Tax=Lacipirellula sp. TaxID=2691419 RepID=UPI003D13C295
MSSVPPSGNAANMADAIAAAREEVVAGRGRIREMHDRGLDGQQVCNRLTTVVDGVVGKLFDAAAAAEGDAAKARNKLALVALGGYGRRQSAPFSDVDLMLLHGSADAKELSALVRRFTNAIFDAGLQLGSSLRSAEEAIQLARTDGVICSSLIDNRLVAGSQPLHQHFRELFDRMVRKRSKAVCKSFCDARAEERNQYGESLYLLEPHVKRSRGGLRDIHLLRWIGFAELGESDPERLFMQGAMSKLDHHRLQSAQAFLLRLRNEMQFHANSAKDLLDRAEQLRIAALMGYRGGEGLLPVEQFMRDYFRHTNHVWQMARRREATTFSGATMTTRMLDPVLGRKVEGDYRIGVREVSATRSGMAKLQGNLGEVLRLVDMSISEGKPLDHSTYSALLLAAPECGEEVSPAVAERFLYLLGTPSLAAPSLRLLHELGYLEKVIPAMKHARCLLQFNQYHKFTVDEHSLHAIEQVTSFAKREDSLGEAYRHVADRKRLHLALLLHDLGKGFEEEHSEVGRRIAEEVGPRLYLHPSATRDVSFLVHQHLNMTDLALRRDIGDRELIRRFATLVETPDRLRMLFVLSCADLAAVGPDVLTQWKVDVLGELFHKTLATLEGQPSPHSRALDERRNEMASVLSPAEQGDAWFERQITAFPAAFLATHSGRDIGAALRRFRKLPEQGADAWGHYNRDNATVEFIAGIDRGRGRGAFSSMAGALSSNGLQILAADMQVMAEDLLLLRFVVTDPDSSGEPPPSRLAAVSKDMIKSVDSKEPPRFRKIWGQDSAEASLRLTGLPNNVRIDNTASATATVVEVYTFDRVGLLYSLARRLHDLELTIWHSKIATNIDQVVDVFYVTNRGGGKIEDAERLEHIRREMLQVIEQR